MDIQSILDQAAPARVPVLVWGPPGVGKSAAIGQWAAKRGLPCWTVIAGIREPSDFAGLPVVAGDDDGGIPSVSFVPPRFAREAGKTGGVIFLDELTTAPPAVQAALLRAVIDRAFGDLELDPGKVMIVAAANPPDQAAGGWELAAPLANRFLHTTYELSVTAWADGFVSYWGTAPELSFAGVSVAGEAWAASRALIAAFIRVHRTSLLAVPKGETQQQAWPSPRSWDYASRVIGAAPGPGRPLTSQVEAIAGCVGEGAATEFVTWANAQDLPDPEQLLSNPGRYRSAERSDIAHAVLASVVSAVVGDLNAKRWLAAWKILAEEARGGRPDVAASCARNLAIAGSKAGGDLPTPGRELRAFAGVLATATQEGL